MSEQISSTETLAGTTITPVPLLKKRVPAEQPVEKAFPAKDIFAVGVDSIFTAANIMRIVESSTNPRKSFDEQGMAELVESVREKGVIQPILIRPAAKGGNYEIVFGARRFRAAQLAGLQTIPAQVRQISDQEVLELQITENLQRRDVHPMEEAIAIEQLLNYGRDLESIAVILGQSTRYVAGRLKLCDLIPDFRSGYLNGFLEHKEAKLICTLTADVQKELLKESVRTDKETGKQKDFQFPHLGTWCAKQQMSLEKAKFNTEDLELVPEMGACGGCPFNSSNSLQLFVGEGGRLCNKPSCYATKTSRAFLATIEELRTDPKNLFVAAWHHSDADKANVKLVRDMGIEVLKDNDFQNIHGLSEDVPDFHIWVEENYSDGLEDEEYEEAEAFKDWEEQKAEEVKDRARYQKELDAGTIQRAFCIAGREAGTFIYVKPSVLTKAAKEARSANTSESDLVKSEIVGIEMRERRAVELDREKVTNQIQDFLASEEVEAKRFQINTGGLSHAESIGFVQFLWASLPHASRVILGGKIGIDAAGRNLEYMTRGEMPLYHALKELSMVRLSELIDAMVRPIILKEFHIKDGPDWEKRGEMATFRQIATDYAPAIVAEFDAEQGEKSEKRKAKVKSRIEALKKKSAE